MPMPYDLRSPEDIAKEYGGNKQKIGAAVQAGLLDPTAGVLAGMFIDRMRNAVVEEQAPTTTVAQDIMSPRPAPAPGAGAVPAGLAAMQSPQAAPMQPTPAPGAGAVQMARGGLAMLDVPDRMYDYGGGGIVAFAEGDAVEERLRLLPVDNLADAYVFLQERGAEIPEDMSEEAIIRYANRVREMENMEVRDAGVRVQSEEAPEARPSWPALFRDYGSGGRGDVVPETRLDTAPQAPMGGGEYAPGFAPTGPVQRGLMPPKATPEGPAPERAIPFLGQMMENIVPSAQAAEPIVAATGTSLSPQAARAELAEIAPDWYDASQRSDAQVVKDLADFKEGAYRTRGEEVTAETAPPVQAPYDLRGDVPAVAKTIPMQPTPAEPAPRLNPPPANTAEFIQSLEAAKAATQPAPPPVQQAMTPAQARAELAEIAPDWYDATQRSDAQVVKDLADFKEGTYRTRGKEVRAEAPDFYAGMGERSRGIPTGGDEFGGLETGDEPILGEMGNLPPDFRAAMRAANAMPPVDAPMAPNAAPITGLPRDMLINFPPAPNAAANPADYLNAETLQREADAALINQLPARTAAPTATTGLGAITPEANVARAAKEAGMGLEGKDKWLALAEFGARMMAGQSPYALQNIGTAGVGTLGSIREMQKTKAAAALKREELDIEKLKAAKEKDTDFRRQLEILTDRRMRENPDLTKGEAEAMAYDDYVAAETSIQAGKLEAQRSRYAQQGRIDVAQELRAWESGLPISDPKTYAQMLKDPAFAAQKRAEKRAELEGRAATEAPATTAGQGTVDSPMQMPASQDKLVQGKVYQTARGLARWDGKQFNPVR